MYYYCNYTVVYLSLYCEAPRTKWDVSSIGGSDGNTLCHLGRDHGVTS